MSKNFGKINAREQKMLADTLGHIEKQLKDPKLADTFLNTLLTKKEKLTIARRLLIASMIQRGETYVAINEKLAVSPNTFTQIKKWLEEVLPDYNTALEHTQKASRKRASVRKQKGKEYTAPLSLQCMKRNYPAHFLLFTLAEELFKKMKS